MWTAFKLILVLALVGVGYFFLKPTNPSVPSSTPHADQLALKENARALLENKIDLPGGCVTGGSVSPKTGTSFYPDDGSKEMVATPFDVLEVERHGAAALHEGRCPVKYTTRSGAVLYGEVALADIAPSKEIAGKLEKRGYNQIDSTTVAEFQSKLRAAIAEHAAAFNQNPADYEADSAEVGRLVALCSQPDADSSLIQERFLADIKAHRLKASERHDPYRDNCSKYELLLGAPLPMKNRRGLMLKFELQDRTAGQKFLRVVVYFQHKPDDAELTQNKNLSIGEAVYMFYDHYGIINTYQDFCTKNRLLKSLGFPGA